MEKNPRMGIDPLSWIKDSREAEPESSISRVLSTPQVHSPPRTGGTQKPPRPSPTASQEGLPEGWIRATFIVQEEHLAKIKALAYWERKQIKEIMTEALSAYLADRRVDPIPER